MERGSGATWKFGYELLSFIRKGIGGNVLTVTGLVCFVSLTN